MDTETIVVAPAAAGTEEHHSYVDWPAVIAGIFLASAISLVLLAFGSAIGLSFADFDAADDVNPIWIAIAAASWLLWVQISSFMAGGYITGRLRRRFNDATEHESDIRDGAHGLLVWAGALVVGAVIAVGGIGAAATAVGNAVGTATMAASNVADDAAGALPTDPNAYFVDTLFRASPGATPAAGSLQGYRGEATRILANGAIAGTVSDTDKAYLAQLVSANTGLSPDEATTRVNEVLCLPHCGLVAGLRRRRLLGGDEGRQPPRQADCVRRLRPLLIRRKAKCFVELVSGFSACRSG
jgi:hypothetical protein